MAGAMCYTYVSKLGTTLVVGLVLAPWIRIGEGIAGLDRSDLLLLPVRTRFRVRDRVSIRGRIRVRIGLGVGLGLGPGVRTWAVIIVCERRKTSCWSSTHT